MYIIQCSEAISSEEEDTKCIITSHVETVNKEMKEISSEEEDIVIGKCGRRNRVGIMNNKLKEWRIHLKLVNHALRLQGVNFYLYNIKWLLIGTNMKFRLVMMMQ